MFIKKNNNMSMLFFLLIINKQNKIEKGKQTTNHLVVNANKRTPKHVSGRRLHRMLIKLGIFVVVLINFSNY